MIKMIDWITTCGANHSLNPGSLWTESSLSDLVSWKSDWGMDWGERNNEYKVESGLSRLAVYCGIKKKVPYKKKTLSVAKIRVLCPGESK